MITSKTENKTGNKTEKKIVLSIPDNKLKRYQVRTAPRVGGNYYFHEFVFEVATDPYNDYVFTVNANYVRRNKDRTGWLVTYLKDTEVTIAKSSVVGKDENGNKYQTETLECSSVLDLGFPAEV